MTLPTTVVSCWWKGSSLPAETSSTPTRFSRKDERATTTLPPESEPSKPAMPRSATLSVTSESHGRQLQMRKTRFAVAGGKDVVDDPRPQERSASMPCRPLLAAVVVARPPAVELLGVSFGGVGTSAVDGVAADGQGP